MDLDWYNERTGAVVDSAIRVHRKLGPGLLESAYQICLAHELEKRGYEIFTQFPIPVSYDGIRLDVGYKADILVDKAVIVEVKAVARLMPVHEAQVLSYLRLANKRLGLLINFHEYRLVDGIRRLRCD